MSSAISEGKEILMLPAGGQNSVLPRKMQAKLPLPLRKVSPAAALWYETSSTCQMRNAVWCWKRNGRHHLYSYKSSSCLESCCHWKKIASLLLIRKLDKTEKDLKELSLEKFTFHSISQQRECSTETCRYSPSCDCQKFPINGPNSWRERAGAVANLHVF